VRAVGRARLTPLYLGALVCLPSVPAAMYLTYITRTSPVWSAVLAQYGNAAVFTPAPALLLLVLGFPAVLVTALLPMHMVVVVRSNMRAIIARARPCDIVVWTWLVVGAILIYLPVDFQIKLLGGWHIPLSFIATRLGFKYIWPSVSRKWPDL